LSQEDPVGIEDQSIIIMVESIDPNEVGMYEISVEATLIHNGIGSIVNNAYKFELEVTYIVDVFPSSHDPLVYKVDDVAIELEFEKFTCYPVIESSQ